MSGRRMLVDDLPWLWIGIVLLIALAHVHDGWKHVRSGAGFGTPNVVAAAMYAALAVWIAMRWRARAGRGNTSS